jgi:lipid A disaccharide synthetase
MEHKMDLALKFEEYQRIINLLSGNTEIVNKVSRFQVAVDELKANQKKLEILLAVSAKDLTIIEKDKTCDCCGSGFADFCP